ncbi:MAG: hypothetical protein QOG42_208, partial [Solirubrobacteraceae bacterium]|nr:hypothetical protein [Solirubrobacteraceae bacterium]
MGGPGGLPAELVDGAGAGSGAQPLAGTR